MQTLLTIVHIIVSLFLCLVILLQSGRGGGMGAAFGGASAQIFGGRGAGNFLTRLTSGAAIIFFVTSLTLSMLSSRHQSVVRGAPAQPDTPASAPATGDSAAPAPGDAASAETAPEASPAAPAPTAAPPTQKADAPAQGEAAPTPSAPAAPPTDKP